MFRFGKISVTPGFWIVLLSMLLIGAHEVLPLVTIAAILHEMGHLTVLRLFGVHVEGINFTAFGAEIRADLRYLPYWKDIICTLAGPAVNIAASLIFARIAEAHLLAGANLLQGAFNLLPMTGLDGARALQLCLCLIFDPMRAERISRWMELTCAAGLTAVTLYAVLRHRAGGFLLLALIGIFVSIWREMRGK